MRMEIEMENHKGLLKAEEVAQRLNIGKSTVYHLTHKGLLPGFKIGGSLRFDPDVVDRYVEECQKQSQKSAA